MKKYLACTVLVALVGCSDSQTAPSSVLGSSSTPAAVSGPTAGPSPAAGVVSLPGLVVTGPTGCRVLSADIIWDVAVNNAGPSGVNGFLVGAFHDGAHGCAATQQGDLGWHWLKHTAGPESYGPTEHGVTRFGAQARWTCGRDQFDISIRGQGLIMSLVVDHGVDCTPESPKPADEPPTPLDAVERFRMARQDGLFTSSNTLDATALATKSVMRLSEPGASRCRRP